MTKKKEKQLLCEDNLRHNEYYGMQSTIDNLYQASANGEVFTDLMSVILQRENILLAYRNIKKNTGSKTSGTDNLTIEDIGKCTPDEVVEKVRFIVNGSKHGYRPKPVRRKEIPKPYDPSKTRPLGIPCIWDRLVQQCIKQVMEPVCEAKFSNNSYGFRPNHSVENAIARSYQLLQHANLHYVIEFDIKGFFDNVNHAKLIRQIWAMGIHDKKLIFLIKRILKAPIRLEDGTTVTPDKGTPQGGIISPLLANIVLNELDHWVESQWQWCPICKRNTRSENGYRQAKKSNLKEMFIVRYADDFRIFCRTKDVAERTKCAVTLWLKERLKLEISEKKTRIVNKDYPCFSNVAMNIQTGAGGRTRTGTVSLPVDFESTTSANSITPAYSGATESLYPVQAKKSTLFLPNHIGNGIFEDIKSLFEGLLFYEQFGHHLDHSIPTAYTFHNQAVFEAFVQYFF